MQYSYPLSNRRKGKSTAENIIRLHIKTSDVDKFVFVQDNSADRYPLMRTTSKLLVRAMVVDRNFRTSVGRHCLEQP